MNHTFFWVVCTVIHQIVWGGWCTKYHCVCFFLFWGCTLPIYPIIPHNTKKILQYLAYVTLGSILEWKMSIKVAVKFDEKYNRWMNNKGEFNIYKCTSRHILMVIKWLNTSIILHILGLIFGDMGGYCTLVPCPPPFSE